jgi:hypothetical protein
MLLSLPATFQLVSEALSVRRIINLQTLSVASAFILVCSAVSVFGQNREKFVISAKAGGINAVTGQAAMHPKGESDWQQLMITDDLEAGDRVRTAQDGRVEILLNPGSYLRLGGNSEVELANNSLANLEVRLLRGTAIVEASGMEETQMQINISTPHARLAIDRQGLYRLNVVPAEATEVIVRKGRVILGDSNTKIKSGNKVTFSATAVSVAKLTDEEKKLEKEVAIEQWSKERAQTLAKANSRINGQLLNSAFARSSDYFLFGTGLWFYNSRSSCYTYLPFGYSSSPYGLSYPTTVYGGFTSGGGGYYHPRTSYGGSAPASGGNGGYTHPATSGGSAGNSASAPMSSTPISPPTREMGDSPLRGFRSERTVEPGRP